MPSRVSAGFDDAPALMRGLASERKFAALGPVECGAEFEQLFHPRGCVLSEDLDDLCVADAGAGALRVDRVQPRRVVGADCGRDAALAPNRSPRLFLGASCRAR